MSIINTNKLNLEEQEKLTAVSHFWRDWGSAISAAVAAAAIAAAGWYGYDWYQNQQSAKAGVLFSDVLESARAGETEKLSAHLKTLQTQFPASIQAQQAGLLAARIFYEKGQTEQSFAALNTVANQSKDEGLQNTAKLQLAGLMIEQKQYDEASKLLAGVTAPAYVALAADRLGDVYALQNKKTEAIAAYQKAYNGMESDLAYRQMIAVKLSGLGVDVSKLTSTVGTTTEETTAQATLTVASSAASTATNTTTATTSATAEAASVAQ